MTIPTGRKIPYRVVKFEAVSEVSRGRAQEYRLGLGIGRSFDLEIRSEFFDGANDARTFDFSYNYIAPVPGFTPGISLGMLDALDNTEDRQRVYVALTFRPLLSTINGDFPGDLTIGVTGGFRTSLFVGLQLPFSREFSLLAEHNGYRLSSGFELRPVRQIGLRLMFRETDVLGSLQLTQRF